MTLAQLNGLLAHATSSGRYYRQLYNMPHEAPTKTIASMDEWHALPFLTKQDLLKVPMLERSFVPLTDVDYISSSSGTTGTLPLFSPRSQLLEYEYRSELYHFGTSALVSTPVPHQQEQFLMARDIEPRAIIIDPRNPAASARLARAAGVDAIFAFLFHMPLIAPHLQKFGVADQIKFIEVTGEVCSRTQFESMQRTFPNAIITSVYGTSEVENSPMGIPCRPMSAQEPLTVYHAKDGYLIELFDPETETMVTPLAGAEGEIIITAYRGEPSAFPFLRYRSGDRARIVEHCKKHGSWSFTVLGRSDMDFVKIHGGMLKADEVERVLRLFPDRVGDTFELHVFEPTTASSRTRLVMHVETRNGTNLEKLAAVVSSALRVAPSYTFEQGVNAGLYEPLVCEPLAISSFNKRKRIMHHRL